MTYNFYKNFGGTILLDAKPADMLRRVLPNERDRDRHSLRDNNRAQGWRGDVAKGEGA